MSSRKRNHPEGYITRPMNCWLIFRQERSKQLAYLHLHQQHLSTIIKEEWKSLPEEKKDIYRLRAKEAKRLHTEKYPNYKFRPRSAAEKAEEARVRKEEKRRARWSSGAHLTHSDSSSEAASPGEQPSQFMYFDSNPNAAPPTSTEQVWDSDNSSVSPDEQPLQVMYFDSNPNMPPTSTDEPVWAHPNAPPYIHDGFGNTQAVFPPDVPAQDVDYFSQFGYNDGLFNFNNELPFDVGSQPEFVQGSSSDGMMYPTGYYYHTPDVDQQADVDCTAYSYPPPPSTASGFQVADIGDMLALCNSASLDFNYGV